MGRNGKNIRFHQVSKFITIRSTQILQEKPGFVNRKMKIIFRNLSKRKVFLTLYKESFPIFCSMTKVGCEPAETLDDI